MKSLITVVVYNKDNPLWLQECLNSIFVDLASSFDVLVCKNGILSSQLNAVLDYYDDLIVVQNMNGTSLAHGLNFVFETVVLHSDYKYWFRMDSDDRAFSMRWDIQVEYLERKSNIDVLGGEMQEFDGKGVLGTTRLASVPNNLRGVYRTPLYHPTVCFRVESLRKIYLERGTIYNEETYFCEDLELWHYLMERSYVLETFSEVLIEFRRFENFYARRGIKKAIYERALFIKYMKTMEQYGVRNLLLVNARLLLSLLPKRFLKYIYDQRLL